MVNICTLGMFNPNYSGEHGIGIGTTSVSTLGMFSTITISEDILEKISRYLSYEIKNNTYFKIFNELRINNLLDDIKLFNISRTDILLELKSNSIKGKLKGD